MTLFFLLAALFVIIAISFISSKIHIGLLALVTAWLFSVFDSSLAINQASELLPIELLFQIIGISLFFFMADQNGTLAKISQSVQRSARGNRHLLALSLFLSTAILSAFGAGNIGSTAIAAGPGMKLSRETRLPPFLSIILIVGGANSTALSPFSMTGILAQKLLTNSHHVLSDGFAWQLFGLSFFSIASVSLLGFYLMGGLRWAHLASLENDISLTSKPWSKSELVTLIILGIFVLLLLGSGLLSYKGMQKNLGILSFTFAAILMLLNLADLKQTLKLLPWETFLLIAGMFALIGLMEKAGYKEWISSALSLLSSAWSKVLVLSLFAAALSVFTSSSGVVMPLFLPLLLPLIENAPGLSLLPLAASVLIASHLVDSSPFSSLGAICLSNIPSHQVETKNRVFHQLFLWGLFMIPMSGILAAIIYFFVA